LETATAVSPGRRVRVVWAALGTAALAHLAWCLVLLAGSDDTQHLETPLALAAAGQFEQGPGSLYGPFRGGNHRVLVHAPLYYRLTALVAWPLVKSGWEPLPACFAAGRGLSFLTLLGSLAVVGRLAVLDGEARRAGAWAMALAASSWIVAGYAPTVRPDMLGVLFQSAGVLAVLQVLVADHGARPRPRGLAAGAALLGLAFCVKQHDVAAAVVTAGLLLHAARTRPDVRAALSVPLLVGLAVVAVDFGVEELVTAGQMSRAVFLLPAGFSRLAPATWRLAVATLVIAAFQSFVVVVSGLACRLARGPSARGGRLDALVWLYFGVEVAWAAVLYRGSAGAWYNYMIQAVLFACVLVGRGLARVSGPGEATRRAWLVGVAALVVLGPDLWILKNEVSLHFRQEVWLRGLLDDLRRVGVQPSREIYFAGLPGLNRRFGRLDLVHDEWLYGLFERVGAADPRSTWLRPALLSTVRVVVVPVDPPIAFPTDPPIIPGLRESLPALGYDPVLAAGRYRVWGRHRAPAPGLRAPGSDRRGALPPGSLP
jgi:hypothetical protein